MAKGLKSNPKKNDAEPLDLIDLVEEVEEGTTEIIVNSDKLAEENGDHLDTFIDHYIDALIHKDSFGNIEKADAEPMDGVKEVKATIFEEMMKKDAIGTRLMFVRVDEEEVEKDLGKDEDVIESVHEGILQVTNNEVIFKENLASLWEKEIQILFCFHTQCRMIECRQINFDVKPVAQHL